jgi:hypothetical protein
MSGLESWPFLLNGWERQAFSRISVSLLSAVLVSRLTA